LLVLEISWVSEQETNTIHSLSDRDSERERERERERESLFIYNLYVVNGEEVSTKLGFFLESFFSFCMDMRRDSVPWTKQRNEPSRPIHHTTGQPQCIQAQIVTRKKTTQEHSSKLASPASHNTPSITPMLLVAFLLVASLLSPVLSTATVSDSGHSLPANQTFHPGSELHKLRRVRAYLRKINKPAVKTIQAYIPLCFMVFSMYISVVFEAWRSELLFSCCRALMVML
jgi:hypothetical protein